MSGSMDPLPDRWCVCGHTEAIHRGESRDGELVAKECLAYCLTSTNCRCKWFRHDTEQHSQFDPIAVAVTREVTR